MYSDKPNAFDDRDRALGEAFTAHAAIAFQGARAGEQIHHLETALLTNRRIGQAIGILMCRRVITENAAFVLLREASQNTHRKLRDIADDVLLTGDLPG